MGPVQHGTWHCQDLQQPHFGSPEKTAELRLVECRRNTADVAASKTGQKKKEKKLAGLTLHRAIARCYISEVYKTIDHKQVITSACSQSCAAGKRGAVPEPTLHCAQPGQNLPMRRAGRALDWNCIQMTKITKKQTCLNTLLSKMLKCFASIRDIS